MRSAVTTSFSASSSWETQEVARSCSWTDALMHHAPAVPHREVVEFVRHHRLHGRGIGWIDVHLLASAVVAHATLWTADPRLASAATELKINYQ